ncbi:MAG: hypothetical protein HY860_02930 [Chlamydiales bacterium]|nr:hypothetical protein [Chlamydiales bacterium]
MKEIVKNLVILNWPRKVISFILAIIIWLVVDQSLTTTKTISNVPIRVINIPEGKTIDGIQSNNILSKRISITITGKKTLLEDLTANDIEVIVDAANKGDEFISTITKRNISSLNPDLNVFQDISKVSAKNFIIKLSKLAKEKIPIFITSPIGEPPKGYQFLDIWPYQIYLTVSGPEEVVKQLKSRGLKLTFNLNDISKAELDNLQSHTTHLRSDVVSFFVPDQWKQIYLPTISKTPIQIDDPDAKFLRIDFIRSELLPLGNSLPVTLFIPTKSRQSPNLDKISFAKTDLIAKQNGLAILNESLYAKGITDLFIEIVKDMIQLVVLYDPDQKKGMTWSVQFINPKVLEDRYVSMLISDTSDDDIRELQPMLRQDYLRNRFRNYMNRFQLFTSDDKLLDLNIQIRDNQIFIEPKKSLN